ncbi:MAG: hypothetical protein AVDCRST_MAG33-734, partial [uncultured Thermomicrobiales bacterium]
GDTGSGPGTTVVRDRWSPFAVPSRLEPDAVRPPDLLPAGLPGPVHLDLVVGVQGVTGDRPRPVRVTGDPALGQPAGSLDDGPVRPVHGEYGHLLRRHRDRGRRAVLHGGLRAGAAAPARPRADPGGLPARPDGPVPVRHDPDLLLPAGPQSARDVLGVHHPGHRPAAVVRHLPDARFLPGATARTGRRGPTRRCQRVADVPAGDAAAIGPRDRDPGRPPVHQHLERVPDAARLRPARRVATGRPRDTVLLRAFHRRPGPDRSGRHDLDAADDRDLPAAPAPVHRGHHRRRPQVI